MIRRPKGNALSFHRGVWNVVYYEDSVRKSKSLGTDDLVQAETRRELFFADATERKTHSEDLYVYKRAPYYVKVGKKLVGQFKTKKEAVEARDAYLALKGGDVL